MKRVNLIRSVIISVLLMVFMLCSAIGQEKEIALQFSINDHKNRALTGRITADIKVTRSGDFAYLDDLFLGSGEVRTTVELEIEEGGSGSILITYNPAEKPLDLYENTAIVDSIEFKSNRLNFILPENNVLIFKIYPEVKEIEIISKSKTGAIRTLSKTQELSASVKAYMEIEADAIIVSEKFGVETEVGEKKINTITDTELREDEVGTRYTVKYPTGALIIEQENKPDQ